MQGIPDDTPRVLLVSPDAEDGRFLYLVLGDHGFEVLWARDAEAAFDVLDREPLSAVVCELAAPRIDGLRILEVTRVRHPDVPVVCLVTDPSVERTAEAM